MKQLDETMKTELVDLFRGIYSADDKIAELKDSAKQFANSKKEMIKNAAEKLEVVPLHIKKAYKEWIAHIEDPEATDEIDNIVAFLQEFVQDKLDE